MTQARSGETQPKTRHQSTKKQHQNTKIWQQKCVFQKFLVTTKKKSLIGTPGIHIPGWTIQHLSWKIPSKMAGFSSQRFLNWVRLVRNQRAFKHPLLQAGKNLPWEPTTFLFRGLKPISLGPKTFIFPWVVGVQFGSWWLSKNMRSQIFRSLPPWFLQ